MTERNLLLLPDQFFDLPDVEVAEGFMLALKWAGQDHMALVASAESRPEILAREGCLVVSASNGVHQIKEAADKPTNTTGWNAVWAAIAFSFDAHSVVQRYLKPGGEEAVVGKRVVMLDRYRNMTQPGEYIA